MGPDVDMMAERLVLVGRLVASIVHEISNPMQAIRGALVLAGEEIDDREAVQAYLNLCLQETDRVIQLTNLLRQIYRPDSSRPQRLDLNQVLNSTLRIAHDEMNRQGVEVQLISGEPVSIESTGNQIDLALLYLFLHLAAAAGAAQVRRLTITTSRLADRALLTILVPLPAQTPASHNLLAKDNPGLGPLYAVIETHRGSLDVQQQADRWVVQMQLPYQIL